MNSNIDDKLDFIIKLLKSQYPSFSEDVRNANYESINRPVQDDVSELRDRMVQDASDLRKENEDLRNQVQFYTTAIEAKSKEEEENTRRIINDQRLMQDTLQQLKDGINSVGEKNEGNYQQLNDVINNFQVTVEYRLNEIQDKLTSNGQFLDDLCDLNSPFQKSKGANDADYLQELFDLFAGDWRILAKALKIPPDDIFEDKMEYDLFRHLLKYWLERQENAWSIADLCVAIGEYGCPFSDVDARKRSTSLRNSSARLGKDLMKFEIIELHLVKEIDLSLSNKQYIKKTDICHDQVIRLLDILQVKGDHAYGAFCKALEASGQGHLADYLKEQRRLIDQPPASNNQEERMHSSSDVVEKAAISIPVNMEEPSCSQDVPDIAHGKSHEISGEYEPIDISEDDEEYLSVSYNSDNVMAGYKKLGLLADHSQFLFAVKEGNAARVSELLTQGVDPNAADKNGHTGLHLAARKDNLEISTILLGSGADINAKDMEWRTPLHGAANKGSLRMTSFLLNCKAQIEAKDSHGFQPLHYAARAGHETIVSILLDNGSPQGYDKHGRTPLHLASYKNHLKTVEALLAREDNRDVSTDVDNNRYLAIHHAAMAGNKEVITRLLKHNKEVLNAKCEPSQYTPLHLAAKYKHTEAVEELLKDNIEHINYASPDNGYTPLHLAALAGGIDTVRVLLRHGARKDVISHAGYTPLILARKGRKHDVVDLLSIEK